MSQMDLNSNHSALLRVASNNTIFQPLFGPFLDTVPVLDFLGRQLKDGNDDDNLKVSSTPLDVFIKGIANNDIKQGI
ncbi:hypothetical protein RDI58_003924 [Solanum bulbocastanum]|uniref:Uncharacterized protein n=1 Tax=Solanum bulbocastanum TaxID=147425 RepID=A0AAN8U4D8_SOLBU